MGSPGLKPHADIIVRRLRTESDSTFLPRSDSAKHRTAVPSQLDCDRQIVPPRQLPSFYLLFPNTFSELLSTGWIREITPKGLGNVPPGVPAYSVTGVTGETCVFVLQRTSKNEQNVTLAAVGGQRCLPGKKKTFLFILYPANIKRLWMATAPFKAHL